MWPLFVGAAAMDLIIKHSKKKRKQENPIPTGKNCISLGWHGHLQFYSDIRLESLYEILKDVPRQHYAKICGDLNATHPLLHFRMNNMPIQLIYKNHPNPEIKKFFQEELKKEVSRLKKILLLISENLLLIYPIATGLFTLGPYVPLVITPIS